MASFASVVRQGIAHAPIASTISEKGKRLEQSHRAENRVEPELVAAVTNLGQYAQIHPTKATPGEQLPSGLFRSKAGFLLKSEVRDVEIDAEVVRKQMEYYRKYVVIAYFVGGKQSSVILREWIVMLASQVGEPLVLGRDLGRGFFQVITKSECAAQKVLMRTPHHSSWGTCLLQNWIPGFNSGRPAGLKVPTWVTLKAVPDEFIGVSKQIAQSLGAILGSDKRNSYSEDQRFCVALLSGMPYETVLGIVNPVTGVRSEIVIDYNNLPIRCRYCMGTNHLVKDCSGLNDGKPKEKEGNSPNPQLNQQEISGGSGQGDGGEVAGPTQQRQGRVEDQQQEGGAGQSREGGSAPTRAAQEPDQHSQREVASGPREEAVPVGPRSEECRGILGEPTQAQDSSGHNTDSSAGGVIHQNSMQDGEINPDEARGFQKIQRKGNRVARSQWMPRTQGCPPQGTVQSDRVGQGVRILETQAGDPGGAGEIPMQGRTSVMDDTPLSSTREGVTSLPTGRTEVGSHNANLPTRTVGQQPGKVRPEKGVARQILQSIDMNRIAENSEAQEAHQGEPFRNFDLNQRNSTFRSFSEGTGGTNFPPNRTARPAGSDIEMIFTSNPTTPRSSDSTVPAHLMAEYKDWLKERHGVILQARIQSPQAVRLANQAILRRNFMGDSSRQHRSRMLVDRRFSRRSVSAEAPRVLQPSFLSNPLL